MNLKALGMAGLWLGAAGLAAAATNASSFAAGHAPKLVCDQSVFHFGTRDSSGEVQHAFVLHNTGDLSLQILNLRATCGCTVGSVTDRTVPPGGETTVTATFALRGREGPQHKVLYVSSNDPTQPEYQLTLEGNIVEAVSVQPRILFFGRLEATATVTGTVEVAANDGQALRITQVTVDSPRLTTILEPATNDKTNRVLVITKPPLPEGLTRALLVVQTGHPRRPRIELSVSFFVPGAFSVLPPEIFVVGRLQEKLSREVVIRSEKNAPFKILAIETPRPDMTAKLTTLSNTAYRVELGNIEVARELDTQKLRVTTDQPNRPEILIPFRVFIR